MSILTGRLHREIPRESSLSLDRRFTQQSLQLIPGHEIVGVINEVGKDVKEFNVGDRCVADNTILVSSPSYPL